MHRLSKWVEPDKFWNSWVWRLRACNKCNIYNRVSEQKAVTLTVHVILPRLTMGSVLPAGQAEMCQFHRCCVPALGEVSSFSNTVLSACSCSPSRTITASTSGNLWNLLVHDPLYSTLEILWSFEIKDSLDLFQFYIQFWRKLLWTRVHGLT